MTSIGEIMAARKALAGYVYETPVINSNALSTKTGHDKVILKCENLQRTGSYHYRGHMYKVLRTIEKELDVDNFVTFSTANGGAALSCAATAFQATARVVVPKNLNESITRSIRHYGGHFYFAKATPEGRGEGVKALMEKFNCAEGKQQHKAVFVHPYTDRQVITGYGSLGVEMMLQTDCEIDCVIAPVGGGSLIAGIAAAVKGMKPNVAVFAAMPMDVCMGDKYVFFKRGDTTHEGDEDYAKQQAAKRGGVEKKIPRVIRGTELSKQISQNYKHCPPNLVDGIIRVNTEEVRYAFRYVYERCKLVVDIKSATAVAAVLASTPELSRYRKVAIVLSGGNVNLNEVPHIAAPKL